MSKGKLAKFADMAEYPHVFEYPFSVAENVPFEMKGHWHRDFFKNDNPIVLELGCGRGEYTVGLGRLFPDKNFIGVDIKGARMWSGATESLNAGMKNVAFLRTNIEIIDRLYKSDTSSLKKVLFISRRHTTDNTPHKPLIFFYKLIKCSFITRVIPFNKKSISIHI